jgi:hypothetical protein
MSPTFVYSLRFVSVAVYIVTDVASCQAITRFDLETGILSEMVILSPVEGLGFAQMPFDKAAYIFTNGFRCIWVRQCFG